jgi:nucleotide-binding universal stress UspA family protein
MLGLDMQGTIVCGVTPASEARASAQLAGALATRLGLRLLLVHVVESQRGGSHGESSLAALAGSLAGAADIRIVHGNRLDALARVAADEGADLIVLAARSHGPRGRQLHCSLATQLEAAQSVPVLIAPPATRARSGRRLGLAEISVER